MVVVVVVGSHYAVDDTDIVQRGRQRESVCVRKIGEGLSVLVHVGFISWSLTFDFSKAKMRCRNHDELHEQVQRRLTHSNNRISLTLPTK